VVVTAADAVTKILLVVLSQDLFDPNKDVDDIFNDDDDDNMVLAANKFLVVVVVGIEVL
jgi:hypothetical protein